MKYTTIRIEGPILSADVLDKIDRGEIIAQAAKDFNFDSKSKVKDEIAKAWADAQELWRVFNHQREKITENSTGTSETRKYWIVPLLGLLGYDAELSKAEIVHGKSYAISHRVSNIDGFPIHIMGFNDSLDKKRSDSGPRMSPHALVQEYVNLTEHLYAFVTNGLQLRLLRDSSRLIKLSFLEFDLEAMMGDEHYADFAIMFRLLHVSRMPNKMESAPESIIEQYHQDALDSGSRIRDGLSKAVEKSIYALANGFLLHPHNEIINKEIDEGRLTPQLFYQALLRLIYRFLFLMVIEERHLIFSKETDREKRDMYYKYYSISRLRNLCEKRYLADQRFSDLWVAIKNTFDLFVFEEKGNKLGINPLAGGLFSYDAIGILVECALDNKTLLESIRNLNVFTHEKTNQIMRVNYASLNVEEFGSVYEGLLEYDPHLRKENGRYKFSFQKGDGRSSSGSHYTPDELVKPLIDHSLEYIIEEKLKEENKEISLLSIRVCDVACGSGHILLSAARRIGIELAKVRTKEDQPTPTALRKAIREIIQNCIYGVDKNPLAVELCKVALWLEAHNPGEPLNFLDHHIKCGDAIVGLAHKEELENGIADEAFNQMPDDDKDVRSLFAKVNKNDRRIKKEDKAYFDQKINVPVLSISNLYKSLNELPEDTVEQTDHKNKVYGRLMTDNNLRNLRIIADIQIAQFFIPKIKENKDKIVTDAEYRDLLAGAQSLQGIKVAKAMAVAQEKRFFHWFLEFPEIFINGGFDCILGNPPYLGGQKLSGTYGDAYLECIKYEFAPIGAVDLVTYFFRRIFSIIKPKGFQSLISTNTIAQGNAREDGLDIIVKQGGTINHAVKSMKWPGKAAVEVALVTITKQAWKGKFVLAGKEVKTITPYLDDAETLGNPFPLKQNEGKSFQGSIVLGKGFILEPREVETLIAKNPKNKEVLFPYLNGDDLNNNPDQSPSRWVINFFDWTEEKAKEYPDCYEIVERLVKPERLKMKGDRGAEYWWQFLRMRGELYRTITQMERVLVMPLTTKYLSFTFSKNNVVVSHAAGVVAFSSSIFVATLNNTFHELFSWKVSSTMGGNTLRYTPSSAFETFPFPQNLSLTQKKQLETIGEAYHEHRRQLMLGMQLGLTKTYNLFHSPALIATPQDKQVAALIKHLEKTKGTISFEKAVNSIIKLRELHVQIDTAVLEAYGWQDVMLRHDFYEVDYLPENDRIRYTISLEARKEILKRLLKLNYEIHEREEKDGLLSAHKKPKTKKSKLADQPGQLTFL